MSDSNSNATNTPIGGDGTLPVTPEKVKTVSFLQASRNGPSTVDSASVAQMIANILYSKASNDKVTPPPATLIAIEGICAGMGITSWDDLALLSNEVISEYYREKGVHPNQQLSIRDQLGISYLIRFASYFPEPPRKGTALANITREVKKKENSLSSSLPPPPVSPASHSSKIIVPELKQFNGIDEESYGWTEDTMNAFG